MADTRKMERTKDVPDLIIALKTSWRTFIHFLRSSATKTLCNISDSRAVELLIAAIKYEIALVCWHVTKVSGALALVGLLALTLSGCRSQAIVTSEKSTSALASQDTPPVAAQATSTTQSASTKMVAATPTKVSPPTPITPPTAAPEIAAEDWGEICQPSPSEEGKTVANLNLGSRVELRGYLYVNPFPFISQGLMPLTFREIPYPWGADMMEQMSWSDACQINVYIPIGSGPNHVSEVPSRFRFADVVVWDKNGQEMQGWQRNLDSFHVLVVGVVVETYGTKTGLGGSNTIRLEEIELLEPSLFSQ